MKDKELRPWEVAKMLEEAGEHISLEVWNGNDDPELRTVSHVSYPNPGKYLAYNQSVESDWYEHARLPQKPERRKITDRYKLMKRCRELDAQGNGILVRWGNYDWFPWLLYSYEITTEGYQYTHLDNNGQPTGEPQDFWEGV